MTPEKKAGDDQNGASNDASAPSSTPTPTPAPAPSSAAGSARPKPVPCPRCHTTTRIAGGLCVRCLLETGLEHDDEPSDETLDQLLAELDLPTESKVLGNYLILEEIGRGGMGVIYRARQRYSGRIVALKRLLCHHANSRETLARFRREAQAAASLDHPNILPIYDVGETDDGLPFFSMKLAVGGSLTNAAAGLRNNTRQSVLLMARVTRAVQHAHGKNVVHRDLKPGNILLDGHGNPLISDFGLAKWLDTASELTNAHTVFGTPGYIAPEQTTDAAGEKKVGAPADIYSLGAILFELLAGRPPFIGSHAVSVIRQAAEKDAPRLRSLCPGTDRDLETICARCLERDPALRYQSAGDLAEDLERWLDDRPILARPTRWPTRLWRWIKRNPLFAITVAACLSVGLLGLFDKLPSVTSRTNNPTPTLPALYVFPLEDLDDLATTTAASQEVTKVLVNALTRSKKIQVQANATDTNAPDPWLLDNWRRIGEETGTRLILNGSVRKRAEKTRVALHIIEAPTGGTLQIFFRDSDSGVTAAELAAQDLAIYLSNKGSTKISQPGETEISEARSYFDRGKEFFFRYNLPDQERAIESFRRAVAIDPTYGQAYAMLATACQLRSLTDRSGTWLAEGEEAATNALRLSPMLPEAHSARAGNFRYRGIYQSSLDPALTAYELDPSSSRAAAKIGTFYNLLGRPDLALRWLGKAIHRETRPVYEDNVADVWTALGNYEAAEKAYQTSGVFRPDLPVSSLGLSAISLYRGDFESARRLCTLARDKYPDHAQPLMMAALIEFYDRRFAKAERLYHQIVGSNRTGGVEFVGSVRFLSALGFILYDKADSAGGEKLVHEACLLDKQELTLAPQNPERLYSLSANQAVLGNSQTALDGLCTAIEAGWIDYRSIELDPRFDSIRNVVEFREMLFLLKRKIQWMRDRSKSFRP